MANRKQAAKETVKTVMVGDVDVKVNLGFASSWEGVMKAVEMQRLITDEEATEGDKLLAAIDYYNGVIANIGEVVEQLGGPTVDSAEVYQVFAAALAEATPKN